MGQAVVNWKTSQRRHDALIDMVTSAVGGARIAKKAMKVYNDPLRDGCGAFTGCQWYQKANDLQKIRLY